MNRLAIQILEDVCKGCETGRGKLVISGNLGPRDDGYNHRQLSYKSHNLNVLGGCCGTDHRHVEEICKAFVPKYVS